MSVYSKLLELLRLPRDLINRSKLRNKDITIFCSNCTGGVIYHNLHLPFLSPTINMWMTPHDFCLFCKDPRKYFDTNIDLLKQTEYTYPIVRIGDITIHCTHYKRFDEFCEKWRTRSKRINWNNIYVIMTERDGCTYDDLITFDGLDYRRKICFVHKEMPEIISSYHIDGSEIAGGRGRGALCFASDKLDWING